MTKRERIVSRAKTQVVFLEPAAFDAALIGTQKGITIYDFDKVINVLIEEMGLTLEEAHDWHSFNMTSVPNVTYRHKRQ